MSQNETCIFNVKIPIIFRDSAESTVNESLAAISAQLTGGLPLVTLEAYNTTEISSTLSSAMATTTEVSTTKRSDSGNRRRPSHQHRKNSTNKKSKNKVFKYYNSIRGKINKTTKIRITMACQKDILFFMSI